MPATEKPKRRKTGGTGQGATRRNSPTSPEGIERRERDLQCVQRRKAGMERVDIAKELDYASPGHAYNRFMVIMHQYPREDVETVREIISSRYDTVIRVLTPKVLIGDLRAIDRYLKTCDQQARLLGANRPEKLEVSAGASELDAALRELEAEMRTHAQAH